MPTTADRCVLLAEEIRQHTDARACSECAAINTAARGLMALAKQGMGAPVAEHLLAQMLRDLGADPDEVAR